VPPDFGFTLLLADVGALDELLELVELGELDELEQAARPPTAMAAAASAATRFDALGMDIFLLVCSAQVEGRAACGHRRLQR
jgi:hypothetical protein